MAEITFIGAAGTVTGSKHLITTNGRHVLVDCGLFQGLHDIVALNSVPLPVAPKDIEAVIVTHGHIDHVGYLPKLVHDGFRGTIYSTPATRALMNVVLEDAVGLQQHLQKRGLHEEHYAPPPFYVEADVQRTIQLTKPIPLQQTFEVAGMNATYQNAAHIIGSAFVQLDVESKRVIFSGDVGRYNGDLLYDPTAIGAADTILCESTYGDRTHPPDAVGDLEAQLEAGVQRNGAVVIPAFAVERAQQLLFAIGEVQRRNPALAKMPVFLDSPMAAAVDDIFNKFPDAHKPIDFERNGMPFGCQNLTVAVTTDQSKAINKTQGAHAIVSASGMAAGGRILHHLYNHLSDAKATIVLVGYQSAGTLGFYLLHGAKTIKIFGDTLPVHAAIADIGGFSAHADRNELQRWLSTCSSKPQFFAIHGEPASAQSLCQLVLEQLHWPASVAERGKTVSI